MKKIIILISIVLFSVCLKAQKYIVYTDSIKAHSKIDSLTKLIVTPMLRHREIIMYGRQITTCYTQLLWNTAHTQCAVIIDDKYSNYFNASDIKNAIILDASWTITKTK